ncbi:hypothetical protein WICPIJ_009981 [Wickerhamomyces pijperi]|uniref:Uncharacterized protein n=1 Tax=Wickerhamomyces pijperi TaxID=599730 RepID=A0A9P8TBF3_WICPI|nr:hypothetical protein WICPIJ_009981 [Wickerhamomyces pijperi]
MELSLKLFSIDFKKVACTFEGSCKQLKNRLDSATVMFLKFKLLKLTSDRAEFSVLAFGICFKEAIVLAVKKQALEFNP